MMKKLMLVPVLFASLSGFALAQSSATAMDSHHMQKMQQQCPGMGNQSAMIVDESQLSASAKEYIDAMNKMHDPMMKGVMDADPDVAFVKGMIPHHEGAVAMAKTVIKYGKDPAIRKLAENVIKAQDEEIKMMDEWLVKHKAAKTQK